MGVDTATPTGKLVLNVLGAIGQFEREVMLERQREGVQRAKREGKYKGRKPTARAKSADIIKARWRGHEARGHRLAAQRRRRERLSRVGRKAGGKLSLRAISAELAA
jgi:DNA invertase Pin-like site-specific DNA recombinase